MQDKYLELTIGALLHDIGKVIYREEKEKKTHSQSGYEFLKEKTSLNNTNILDSIRYHHAGALKGAKIEDDSVAYIVYMADNIASSVDRRNKMEDEKGFEIHVPLQPVFNLLNGNRGNTYYDPYKFNVENAINYPVDEKKLFAKEQYTSIMRNIEENLRGIELSSNYVNSLLEILEANLSYVPSSTSNAEVPDISLYDHVKITAAFACTMMQKLEEQQINNYKDVLFQNSETYYDEKNFLIASIDFSGIQKFIYTIQTKNALRNLRARSFYLEIMMEHMIDELLEKLGLSRCNLLYSGGGHCYLLLSNTDECKKRIDEYIEKTNEWLLDKFQVELFVAGGYTECSANELKNIPNGSYEEIFRSLSRSLSYKKLHRYTPQMLRILNNSTEDDYSKECGVCKRVAKIDENGLCPLCAAIEKMSANVLYSDFFTVCVGETKDKLPLPGNYSLIWDTKESLTNRMKNDEKFVRVYSKNKSYTGQQVATKIWVGNYTTKSSFEEFAESAQGINRIGILRADVDNLGQAFVSGFTNKENQNRYVTISRTATLSRQLSLFFKLHINKILENPEYTLDGRKPEKRNITIVYSGGDDIFVVGAWNEVIEFSVDLRNALKKYTEDTLHISAGIGIYENSYPISASAIEVENQVDASKDNDGKDSVTLLEDGEKHKGSDNDKFISDGTYHWDEFVDEVIKEKYQLIQFYMKKSENIHGNALLYRLLELIRNQKERINFARFIYVLARLEPEDKMNQDLMESFEAFSSKMAQWIKNEKDRRQLKTAITLYVYLNRGEEHE